MWYTVLLCVVQGEGEGAAECPDTHHLPDHRRREGEGCRAGAEGPPLQLWEIYIGGRCMQDVIHNLYIEENWISFSFSFCQNNGKISPAL